MPALDNPKHERFAQELAKGRTEGEAYVLAGYASDRGNASRLTANDSVQARVAEIVERAAVRAEVSKSWVMERLMRNAQMCLGEEPMVVPTPEGEEPVAEYRRDPAAANTALQLLGKELGMFVDRSISATTTLEEMLDKLDDAGAPAGPAAEPGAAAE